MVHDAGRISRNRPAVIGENIRIQYGEFDLMVSATAILLREAGVQRGVRVAIYMESGWAYITLIFALLRMGVVVCPMSTRLPLAPLKSQLASISCTCLIARVSDKSREELCDVLCLDPDGLVSRELTSGQSGDSFAMPLHEPATIVFSSGSTGAPKAIMHSYGNHYYSAYGANRNVPLRSEDCWLVSLPLYHVGGLGILFRCMQTGAAMATMSLSDTLADGLTKFPVTHLSVVPTQLRRLLDLSLAPEIVKRLKAVLVGGSELPASLLQAAREAGWPVIPTYGLSEMSSQVTACAPYGPKDKATSSGTPLRYREVRIAADGEIWVRGATLFQGYVEGGTVRAALDKDGWFATGDLGAMDDDGYLHVQGRKDNMFISGGENIYPEEIERELLDIKGVRQAIVVPVPDEEYGYRPVAFLDRETTLTDQAVEDALKHVLPRFKVPAALHDWREAAQSEHSLKPDRAWFREQAMG